jgi:predicted transcriptional regulator
VDTNEWQLSEIQAALTEAEAQDYATDQDMADLALKWNTGAHAGRPNTLLAILP